MTYIHTKSYIQFSKTHTFILIFPDNFTLVHAQLYTCSLAFLHSFGTSYTWTGLSKKAKFWEKWKVLHKEERRVERSHWKKMRPSWVLKKNWILLRNSICSLRTFLLFNFVLVSCKTKECHGKAGTVAERSRASARNRSEWTVPGSNPALGWRTKWKPYCLLPHVAINTYETRCTTWWKQKYNWWYTGE